ncbi:MAG: hypothetical protein AAGM67_13630 [Bacteroidota bacterium]
MPAHYRQLLRECFNLNPSAPPRELARIVEEKFSVTVSESEFRLLKSFRKCVLKPEWQKLKKVAQSSSKGDLLSWCDNEFLLRKVQGESGGNFDQFTTGVIGYFFADEREVELDGKSSFYAVIASFYSLANVLRAEYKGRLVFYSDATYDPCYENTFKVSKSIEER